jgi:hypothetical protein
MEIWANFLGGSLDGRRVKAVNRIYDVPIKQPVKFGTQEDWDKVDTSDKITEQYFLYKCIRGSAAGNYYYVTGKWRHRLSKVYYEEV